MKTSEILNLDYRLKENKEIIQNALRKIIEMPDCEKKISITILEKYISDCEKEYSMMIGYICTTFVEGIENRYCATIHDKILEKRIDYVYACSIYELYAKICILYYSKIKTDKCKKVDWEELNRKRKERLAT